jgi:predicted GIY-YIG superfamily endonuclease
MKTHMIYALVNPITNEPFYVGETTNLTTRLSKHFGISEPNKLKNEYIQNLINNGYNIQIWILGIGIATKEEAVKIESDYIEKYNKAGYILFNKNKGGNKPPSQKGKYQSEKTKELRSINSPLIKKVQQIDKDGNVVNEFYGVREACRKTKIDHRSIAQVAAGSNIRKTAGGYKWKYI